MPFQNFAFPDVQQALGLSLAEADLFAGVEPVELREEFVALVREGADLALAVNTEKARSEFIIAPVLFELRRLLGRSFGLFSGIEFNVDAARGLNGFCDFLLTRSPRQILLSAPIVAIVEAKNDNLRSGLGQCIAAMVAAQVYNEKAGTSVRAVSGAVTTGSAWKFLQLVGAEVTVDTHEYYVVALGKIMGILAHLIRSA